MKPSELDALAEAVRSAPRTRREPTDGLPGAENPTSTPADPRSPLAIARELRRQFESSRATR